MVLSDSSSQDYPYTSRSKGTCIMFDQFGSIDHCKHVPGPVAQSSADSEYYSACNEVIALAYFRMLNNDFFNKDTDVVP